MKLMFLGTGASDWDINAPEREEGFRRYTSTLVDGCLLIDPGPCVIEALETFGVDKKGIKYIINTHNHRDHYNTETIDILQRAGAEFIAFSAGETKELGGYKISAYTANHGTCKDAIHFIIEDGSKKLFYGLDSAWLLYDEVKAIKEKHIDLAVLDGTIGETEGDYRIFEHNNLRMIREMKLTLNDYVDRFFISHMARTLHTDHNTLSELMKKDGIEVAYDGLEITI